MIEAKYRDLWLRKELAELLQRHGAELEALHTHPGEDPIIQVTMKEVKAMDGSVLLEHSRFTL